jgi:hypothetical protein
MIEQEEFVDEPEDFPVASEEHPDDAELVEEEDYVDDSEPVDFNEADLDEIDFDSIDVDDIKEGDEE